MSLLQLYNIALPPALNPVTGMVHAGELIHLVGPNGAGKSTLLMLMAGLIRDEGEIIFDGNKLRHWSLPQLARKRAYLPQHQSVPFAMPIWHYLKLHQAIPHSDKVITKVTQALGLDKKLTRRINQLSGGEWQRVRLAAVLLQIHPDIHADGRLLLLDEPTSGLDVAQQVALDRLLSSFCEAGIAIVMSSHDLNHSLRHAHSVWLLRQGQMLAMGKSDSVLTPQYLFSAFDIHFHCLHVKGYNVLVTSPLNRE